MSAGDNLLTALISGSTATAAASVITYPLDFLKTQQQLNNPQFMAKYAVASNSPTTLAQLFCGSSALVLGNVAKNQARLISYNWATKFMSLESHHDDGNGAVKTSAPRMVIAGAMSAFIETLFIIPFENIKIVMIQNRLLANELAHATPADAAANAAPASTPQTAAGSVHIRNSSAHRPFQRHYQSPHAYLLSDAIAHHRSGHHGSGAFGAPSGASPDKLKRMFNRAPPLTFWATTMQIYALRGLSGFARGTFITMTRQVAISTVWLSTYTATRQLLDPSKTSNPSIDGSQWFGHKHSALQSMGLHLLSSLAVVVATQPLDVIKSHMQSKNGRVLYRDSLSTAYRLFVTQGATKLWAGALPRGLKVFASGGLTATLYSYIDGVVNVAGGQRVFAAE
ncbi:Mitochondrial carrier protein [[Candida] zeylanoides]